MRKLILIVIGILIFAYGAYNTIQYLKPYELKIEELDYTIAVVNEYNETIVYRPLVEKPRALYVYVSKEAKYGYGEEAILNNTGKVIPLRPGFNVIKVNNEYYIIYLNENYEVEYESITNVYPRISPLALSVEASENARKAIITYTVVPVIVGALWSIIAISFGYRGAGRART